MLEQFARKNMMSIPPGILMGNDSPGANSCILPDLHVGVPEFPQATSPLHQPSSLGRF